MTVHASRDHVRALLSSGLTHNEIAEALGNRVSARTVYRWARGETAPQRLSDRVALEQLVGAASAPASA